MRLLVAALLLLASPAFASKPAPIRQGNDVPAGVCPCCETVCLKPWSVADRWDDTSVPSHLDWVNNGRHDHEPFADTNGNRVHDPGEPYTDQNGNQQYDEEFYHPFLTGYVAWKDSGRPVVLKPGSPSDAVAAGHFNALDFTGTGKQDESGNRYVTDIAECSHIHHRPGDQINLHPGFLAGPTRTGMLELIARDPEAYWDPATERVSNEQSPRIGIIALHDPRIEPGPGRHTIVVAKLAAFFLEGIDAHGNVIGRFIRVQSPDFGLCPMDEPREAAFLLTDCPRKVRAGQRSNRRSPDSPGRACSRWRRAWPWRAIVCAPWRWASAKDRRGSRP